MQPTSFTSVLGISDSFLLIYFYHPLLSQEGEVSSSSISIVPGPWNNLAIWFSCPILHIERLLWLLMTAISQQISYHVSWISQYSLELFLWGGRGQGAVHPNKHPVLFLTWESIQLTVLGWMGRQINTWKVKFSQDHRLVLRVKEGLRRACVERNL